MEELQKIFFTFIMISNIIVIAVLREGLTLETPVSIAITLLIVCNAACVSSLLKEW